MAKRKQNPGVRKGQAKAGSGEPAPELEQKARPSKGSELGAVQPTPHQPVRTARGTFAPGTSGNPAGGPKMDPLVRELAKTHSAEAIDTLVQLMRTAKPEVRKAAADSILDRAYGKPPQAISGPDGGAIPLGVSEMLMAKLKALVEAPANASGPVGGAVEAKAAGTSGGGGDGARDGKGGGG